MVGLPSRNYLKQVRFLAETITRRLPQALEPVSTGDAEAGQGAEGKQ